MQTAAVFRGVVPRTLETWHSAATRGRVEFVRRDYFTPAQHVFMREAFSRMAAFLRPRSDPRGARHATGHGVCSKSERSVAGQLVYWPRGDVNMRWERARRSTNVDDRRGRSGAGMVGGGGIGMIVIVLAVSFLTGRNPLELLQVVDSGSGGPVSSAPGGAPPADDEHAQFIAAVLGDTEDTWDRIFTAQGQRYEPPVLVLFDDMVGSACGSASSAVGPFYCPADRQVYIDLSFFRDLDRRFGAPGDFAQAYVVAHEVGHHIQTVVGISSRVQQQRARASKAESNALSVRQELQADCFAGVWGHHAGRRDLLEPGDVEEGLQAAAAIGDDRLQRRSGNVVVPESFTHGTSAQRVEWLKRGLETGDINQCDTFEGRL